MITLLITDDEVKAKEAIINLLKQEGYTLTEPSDGENTIRIVKKNCIRDLAFIKDQVIELEESLLNEKNGVLYKSILEAIEKPLIEQVLEKTDGNQLKAAKILGLNRNTLRTKIQKLRIDCSRFKQF